MIPTARIVNEGKNPGGVEKARIEFEGLADLGDAPVDVSGFTAHLMIVNPLNPEPGWLLVRRPDRVPLGELAPGNDSWQTFDSVYLCASVSAGIVASLAPDLSSFVIERTQSVAADLARIEGMGAAAEGLKAQADEVGSLHRWHLLVLALEIQGHTHDEAIDKARERVSKREFIEFIRPVAGKTALEWYGKMEAETHMLAAALLEATGCENLVALSERDDVLGVLDPAERRAIELRLGLDLIQSGKDGVIRMPVEVGQKMGLSLGDAEALLDSGLALLIPGYPDTVWPDGRTSRPGEDDDR